MRGTEKKGRYDLLALDAEFGTLLGEARAELLGPALVLPLFPVQLLTGVQLAKLYSQHNRTVSTTIQVLELYS